MTTPTREERIKAWEEGACAEPYRLGFYLRAYEIVTALTLMREPHVPADVMELAKVVDEVSGSLSGAELARRILSLPSSPTPPVVDSAEVDRLRAENTKLCAELEKLRAAVKPNMGRALWLVDLLEAELRGVGR